MRKENREIINNLIGAIRANVPEDVKVPDYLMDLLSLGKEAIYRRLRGEIMFNLDELIGISRELNISLDEILNFQENKSYKATFDTTLLFYDDPRTELQRTFQVNNDLYEKMKRTPNAKVQIATNLIPYQFFLKYKLLAKMPSYKWLYQTQSFDEVVEFADYNVTDEISMLAQEFVKTSNAVDIDLIFDRNTFASYMEDIAFFIKLNLIKKEDVQLLKEDLLALINDLEVKSATGNLTSKSRISVYISNISIETTYALFEADNFQIAHFRVYGISNITSSNLEICKAHRMWINSLKRYSTLITQSGDLARSEYFNQQRHLIDRFL